MIKGIVCIGANGVMGNKGSMPWGDKPLDGRHFRSLTEGHTVVMGRKTFESMGRKSLPNRISLVITKQTNYHVPPSTVNVLVSDVEDVVRANEKFPEKEYWIIGGAQVFEEFMPHIEEMYVTVVGDTFEGDVFFPTELMFDESYGHFWNTELLGHEVIRTVEREPLDLSANYSIANDIMIEPPELKYKDYMLTYRKFTKA